MSKHIYVDNKHRFQASVNDDGQIDGLLIGITAPKLSEILDELEKISVMDALLEECAPFVMMCIEDSLKAEALYKKLKQQGYGQ